MPDFCRPVILFILMMMLTIVPGVSAQSANIPTIQNWQSWEKIVSHSPAPAVGCFEVSYPDTVWQQRECQVGIPLPFTVGNGCCDYVAKSSATLVADSSGSFTSMTGFSSESSGGNANYFSLQLNSQTFTTNTLYTGGRSATGWEQFIYANPYPGTSNGQIFIQYWLIGYGSTCPTTGPPGGTSWISDGHSNCYANSPTNILSGKYQASQLTSLSLIGQAGECYPTCDHLPGQPYDYAILCVSGTCSQVSVSMYVLNLYANWKQSEFNVFGDGGGSQARFNNGVSITVQTALADNQGFAIAPSCINTSFTGETNNLNVGTTCTTSASAGTITFTMTDPPSCSASASPTSGRYSVNVQFTVTCSGGTPPYNYNWHFNDGSGATSNLQSPQYTYSTFGGPSVYSPTLTVTDSGNPVGTANPSVPSITVTCPSPCPQSPPP